MKTMKLINNKEKNGIFQRNNKKYWNIKENKNLK